MDVTRRLRGVWGACAVALLARLSAFVLLGRFAHPDVCESEIIALNLLQGKGFIYHFLGTDYRSYMEPLYPGLCAGVYAVTGHSAVALGLVQIALGTALVWLVFACARRLASDRAAVVAAWLTALHPGLILYTTKFHPLILDTVCITLVVAGCLWYGERPRWRSVVRLGGLLGLCVLTRPTIVAAVPLIGWWVWRRSPPRPGLRVGEFLVIVGCAAAVVAPWVWRNYHVHHRLILTRSGTSMVFWIGNNPYRFTGSALTPEGDPVLISVAPPAVRTQLLSLDELGQQDLLLAQARQFVREHPWEFLRRWAVKWVYFWWFTPQAGLLYPPRWIRAYHAVSAPLLLLLLIGAWTLWHPQPGMWRDRQAGWLLAALCAAIALLQSLFYIEGRHRLAIEPLLLIFVSQGIWRVWSGQRGAASCRTGTE